ERGSLGTITDLIEYNISKKLSEENPSRFQYDPLTAGKAREGTETLAAAAILCKRYSFLLPDEDLSIAAPSSSIVPREVLKDWELRELQALLTRAIFDEATYGRVRFHHRSVTEYLAARWFHGLIQRGCSIRSILHIFFKEIFGSTIAVRSFIGVASWLASFSQDFRAVALKVEPVILFGGDPQQISPEYRARALSEFAERYKERKYSGWIFDNADLRRMAHPELTSTINSLLEEHKHSVDVRDLLLRIVRLGNLTGCSETAVSIALDSAQDELVRIEAIRCLGAIASMEQKSKLACYIKTTKELSNGLIAAFCEALFPEAFSAADCVSLISRAKREIRNAQTMLPYVIEKEIVSKCPKENLLELLDGLLELSRQPPPKNLHGKKVISELFWWIPNAIGKAFVRVLQELNPEAIPLKALKSTLFLLQFCHTYKEPFIHDLDYVSDELQKHSWLRRKFYWARLKAKRDEIGLFGRILPGRVYDLCPLLVEDFDWLIEEINAQPSLEDRKKALESALDLWVLQGEIKSELAQKILDSTKGTPELHSIAQSAIYRKPGKWDKRYALRQQIEEEKAQKKKRIQLEEARRHLSPKIDQIRSGDAFHEIYYLWDYADSKTEREGSAQWGKASYEVLIPDFGKAMAEAAKKGFEATWRRWRPPLPHKMKDPRKTEHGTLVGLAGLRIEAEEGLDFSILSTEEAKNAAHYALRELNGFPEWFPSLVKEQPDILSEVLLAAFSNEMLEDPRKEKRHEVISYIQYQPAEVLNFCAPLLLELLHSTQPNHVQTLESSLRIVLSSSSVDSEQVAELAKREVQCFVRKRDYEFLIPWVVVWLHVDPNEAWDFVE
ncbi:hypothetical protein KA005_36150, partial [bacterium]|nr:hypothetical protein [bacterium]